MAPRCQFAPPRRAANSAAVLKGATLPELGAAMAAVLGRHWAGPEWQPWRRVAIRAAVLKYLFAVPRLVDPLSRRGTANIYEKRTSDTFT
jgi:hypothetical protein